MFPGLQILCGNDYGNIGRKSQDNDNTRQGWATVGVPSLASVHTALVY